MQCDENKAEERIANDSIDILRKRYEDFKVSSGEVLRDFRERQSLKFLDGNLSPSAAFDAAWSILGESLRLNVMPP